MADVFISYAGEDRATASALSRVLESSGWSVWWDRELAAGDHFAAVIERELDEARAVVVLWSHAAARSRWVAAEGQRAFDAEKAVPVRLDDRALPLPLSMIQAPGLAGWDRTPGDPRIEELRSTIFATLDTSRLLAVAPGPLFRCVALGDWGVAAGGHDGVVRVWSLSDGRPLGELTGHGDVVTAVAWNGNELLASGGSDRTAIIWSLGQGRPLHTLVGHGGPVDDVAFAGQELVTVSADRTVRWWSVAEGRPLRSQVLDQPIVSCAADQSGRIVAVGGTTGDAIVFVGGSIANRLADAHSGPIYATDLSPDGSRLLTTGADGIARLWATSSGAMLSTFRGHRGPVLAGAIGLDVVVTGSSDGTVKRWDTETTRQVDQVAGLVGGAVGISITEGGTIVITSGSGQLRTAGATTSIGPEPAWRSEKWGQR